MNNVAYFLISVSLNDETPVHEVSSECDYSITHPEIIDTEIIGIEDKDGDELIKVKATFKQEVSEHYVAGVFVSEDCRWDIQHESIDDATLLTYKMK